MQDMTRDEIEAYVRRFVVEAGLEPVSISVEADEPPMDFYPIVDVVVSKKELGAKGVVFAMEALEAAMSKDRGTSIRTGYYEKEASDLGPDDDPDHVMIEIDQFDFGLAANPPVPGAG